MARKRLGEPYVWLSASALTVSLLITGLLVWVILASGLTYFWPKPLFRVELEQGETILGEIAGRDEDPVTGEERIQFKIGNKDLHGLDFRWIDSSAIQERVGPEDAVSVERLSGGDYFGFLQTVEAGRRVSLEPGAPWDRLQAARARVEELDDELARYENQTSSLNRRARKLRDAVKRVEYRGGSEERIAALEARAEEAISELEAIQQTATEKKDELHETVAVFRGPAEKETRISVADIVRAYRPNGMSFGEKLRLYFSRVWELLTEEPRESNTKGGLAPAIFGTVFMVFLMSIFCVPLGVLAAIYLHEYAKEGLFVRAVRIAVNNLAGVPSIVYGIFGLGFFVYGIGASIDDLFFAYRLPEPTFGTGGVLWASLTLALLTVPVVIVSTEEGLAAIPSGIREGSVGLGATRFQTLTRTVLPMASPGIMTGFVLAMTRAAGEVAPLMLIGVVRYAPALPVDGQFPYVHFDRKFMHLGYHIYDVGFQSPNVEAVRPMVYVTTMLLLLIVVFMSFVAILLRNHMRKKYTSGSF